MKFKIFFKIFVIGFIGLALIFVGLALWSLYQDQRGGSVIHEWEEGQEGLLNSADDIGVVLAPTIEQEKRWERERSPSLIFAGGEEDYIEIEIVAEDYELRQRLDIEGNAFLMKVKVEAEVVGVVYFDTDDRIKFEGDKEKFEQALLKVLRGRKAWWFKVRPTIYGDRPSPSDELRYDYVLRGRWD